MRKIIRAWICIFITMLMLTVTCMAEETDSQATNGLQYSSLGAIDMPQMPVSNDNWMQVNLDNIQFGGFDTSGFNIENNTGFNTDAMQLQYANGQKAMLGDGWGSTEKLELPEFTGNSMGTMDFFSSMFGDKTSEMALSVEDVPQGALDEALSAGMAAQNSLAGNFRSGSGYNSTQGLVNGVSSTVSSMAGRDLSGVYSLSGAGALDTSLSHIGSANSGAFSSAFSSAFGSMDGMASSYASTLSRMSHDNSTAAFSFGRAISNNVPTAAAAFESQVMRASASAAVKFNNLDFTQKAYEDSPAFGAQVKELLGQ